MKKAVINFEAFSILIGCLFVDDLSIFRDLSDPEDNAPTAALVATALELMGLDPKELGPRVSASVWCEPGDMAKFTWLHRGRRTVNEYLSDVRKAWEKKHLA